MTDIGNQIEHRSDADRGCEAAGRLWEHWLKKPIEIDDPFSVDFARAALAEFERLQQKTSGVHREALNSAQRSAEQLNVEPFQGINEIIQNADDSHATEVRVAINKSGKQRRLLIAHNGDRIRLSNVLAMTFAFLSDKGDDPHSKGRFGIGLKTLARLGGVLAVHCAPYNFRIVGSQVYAAKPARAIPGFFDPTTTDTLFELRLHESLDVEEFQNWLSELGAGSLIFLDTVRAVKLILIGKSRPRVHHELTEVSSNRLTLPSLREPCKLTVLNERGSKRYWERFEIERKMPKHLVRRYKARTDVTPTAIAFSSSNDQTQIYAGLLLHISAGLPFNINAQFDPDVARRGIQHEVLNEWLLEQAADLASAIARYQFLNRPSPAWRAVPLKKENSITNDLWLRDQIADLVDSVQSKVRQTLKVPVEGDLRKLGQLGYEAKTLEGVICSSELTALRPQLKLLPISARDENGRWRSVLAELRDATHIDVAEALHLLDWEDEELGAKDIKWFISLVRAGLDENLGETLWNQRSIVTADGKRIVPPMPNVEGELLLRRDHLESLASRLGLAHVINPAYLAENEDARKVGTWLEDKNMLRDEADAEATLRALAAHDWKGNSPQVEDEELRLIRDALASIDVSLQKELGIQIGKAIRVDVQQWVSSRRTTATAPPAEAYLPASIEDRKDGWSKAAGRTEGLSWITRATRTY